MVANPARRRPGRLVLTLAAAGFAVASAAGGCDCQGGGVSQVAPKIEVTPTSITFPPTAVDAEADQVVTLRNAGNDNLKITADPTVVEGTEDTKTELALRAALTPVDCATGAARTAKDPKILLPGDCDTVTVVYRPQNIGTDTGKLVLESNDPKTPEVDVPIDASGAAPKIQVCLLAGDCVSKKVCNQVGGHLDLPFPLTTLNGSTTCPVSISNVGQLPLKNLQWSFKSGNRYQDYSLDPADIGAPGDLPPGQGIQAKIHFAPKAGGAHQAIVELASSDPVQSVVDIYLTGKGDGPKLCPDPVPTEDFGAVTVGQTATKSIKLSDCGTQPLSITTLAVQDATGAGPSTQYQLGAGAPSAPVSLTAGQTVQVPVDFKPDSATTFNGRLYLESTDPTVPQGWINLTGQGEVPPSCQLQVATTTLDFGQAATGYPVDKVLAISNAGKLPCTGVTGTVTAGAAVQFSVVGVPPGTSPYTLQPGDIVTFKLEYAPADATGPDTGTFEVASPDAAGPIDVTLQGTPVANPTCQLSVTPHTGNFNFSGCITLSITPRVAEFGTVRVGEKKTLTASLENTGSIDCHVSSIKMVGVDITNFFQPDPNYTLVNGQQVTVGGTATSTIKPGQVGLVSVLYAPPKEATDCGGLQIQTDDPHADGSECTSMNGGSTGCYQVFLQGQGVQSDIEVIPTSVDFGVITVGCASLERTVTIYNNGGASMKVTSIYIDPPGKGQPQSGPFTIASLPPMPTTIPAGGTLAIKVKYRPASTNADNAVLAIESDAANASIMTVPLKGQGTTDSHQTDTFTQLSQPTVDVLFMIDNSCSMSDKQKSLADNSASFFQTATTLNTDYHVAVVSNDMADASQSGNFQARNGAPKNHHPPDPQPGAGLLRQRAARRPGRRRAGARGGPRGADPTLDQRPGQERRLPPGRRQAGGGGGDGRGRPVQGHGGLLRGLPQEHQGLPQRRPDELLVGGRLRRGHQEARGLHHPHRRHRGEGPEAGRRGQPHQRHQPLHLRQRLGQDRGRPGAQHLRAALPVLPHPGPGGLEHRGEGERRRR